ncbi:hypothetical protein [Neotabrizicola sp. VNH66]|uniref:hypothetical protein n=1 Tax=Neotabrizicola sp. VNH66 TaxID=3400918 RepID=UPI003C01AA09
MEYKLYSRMSGALSENDDEWHLVVDDATGDMHVRHEWSHMDPYKGKVTSEGTKELTVEEFLASNAPIAAKDALLAKRGELGL